jgi:hypothetical protein
VASRRFFDKRKRFLSTPIDEPRIQGGQRHGFLR